MYFPRCYDHSYNLIYKPSCMNIVSVLVLLPKRALDISGKQIISPNTHIMVHLVLSHQPYFRRSVLALISLLAMKIMTRVTQWMLKFPFGNTALVVGHGPNVDPEANMPAIWTSAGMWNVCLEIDIMLITSSRRLRPSLLHLSLNQVRYTKDCHIFQNRRKRK
jgi:hypothetical protein